MHKHDLNMIAWKKAVAEGATHLGFAAWLTEQPQPPSSRELAEAFHTVANAQASLRAALRPFAVEVLGDWAADDVKSHRNGHYWRATPTYSDDGMSVIRLTFTETVAGFGHNEVDSHKTHTMDLD